MSKLSRKQQASLRRKQRKKQKEKQKRKELQRKSATFQPNVRHRQRIAQQLPRAWEGETTEDVAFFDPVVHGRLDADRQREVADARAALALLCEGPASASRSQEALQRVSRIPRKSPLGEWKLFIRGLVAWLDDELETARTNWARLTPERRPGRIATTLLASQCPDLLTADPTSMHAPPENAPVDSQPEDNRQQAGDSQPLPGLDKSMLYAAKLVRRIRIDRAALRIAQAALSRPDEDPELLIGPQKVKWLKDFSKNFQATEPQLVNALQRTALLRAFAQPFVDVFEVVTKTFRGPPHDPRHSLLAFFYHSSFSNAHEKEDERLQQYLTVDLPQCQELSEPLRNAMVSQCYLHEAQSLLLESKNMPFRFLMGDDDETEQTIAEYLARSTKAYPKNIAAHKTRTQWLESKLENDRLSKEEQKSLTRRLVKAMKCRAESIPEDVVSRLWLVDHWLENEELDKAKPYIQWLEGARQDNPRVRAMPWKWQLLEVMRLCRRKAWLVEAGEKLEAVEASWPAWLAKDWLPYLRAAWLLRSGKQAEYQQVRETLCRDRGMARDSLADACMMLGAAQRMRVPAADLKPLRVPVDRAVQNLESLELADLVAAGSFFWDLHRTRLLYPAYRMHGSKFGQELLRRIVQQPDLLARGIDQQKFLDTLLWLSERRFWSNGYDLRLPRGLESLTRKHAFVAAALLNAVLKMTYKRQLTKYDKAREQLREATQRERDPFYRFWFQSLADQVDEELAKRQSYRSGMKPFSTAFAGDDDEEEFEYDDDDAPDFDPDCNCPECQAARENAQATAASTNQRFFVDF